MDNIFNYYSRVNFDKNDLVDILQDIVKKYHFTKMKYYKIIETGYEDFNVYLETISNKYVVKIFQTLEQKITLSIMQKLLR